MRPPCTFPHCRQEMLMIIFTAVWFTVSVLPVISRAKLNTVVIVLIHQVFTDLSWEEVMSCRQAGRQNYWISRFLSAWYISCFTRYHPSHRGPVIQSSSGESFPFKSWHQNSRGFLQPSLKGKEKQMHTDQAAESWSHECASVRHQPGTKNKICF